jgi:hypothetical protein
VLSEDFNRTAAPGSFKDVYRGWSAYDGARDTSRNGTYNSDAVMSVHGGMADKFLHSTGSGPQVAALTPPIKGQQYGRYSVRFKTDKISGYKIAWLLWPTSENWAKGEVDFPEADLDGTISGFSHDVTGNPSRNAWVVDTKKSLTDWHTATIEWMPGKLTYNLDGQSWTTTDRSAIPTDPMRWVLQTETALSGKAPTGSGHVYVDWVAAWSRG